MKDKKIDNQELLDLLLQPVERELSDEADSERKKMLRLKLQEIMLELDRLHEMHEED